jgi:hypothetical protein
MNRHLKSHQRTIHLAKYNILASFDANYFAVNACGRPKATSQTLEQVLGRSPNRSPKAPNPPILVNCRPIAATPARRQKPLGSKGKARSSRRANRLASRSSPQNFNLMFGYDETLGLW